MSLGRGYTKFMVREGVFVDLVLMVEIRIRIEVCLLDLTW